MEFDFDTRMAPLQQYFQSILLGVGIATVWLFLV